MDLRQLEEEYGLSPKESRAVREAYDVFCEHTAPFMVSIAAQMHDDLKNDVAEKPPGHRIVFLGRDGASLSRATKELDPEFYKDHCSFVTLSRAVAEAALQDIERDQGKSFDRIEAFRGARGKVNPDHVEGSYSTTAEMFERNGVPIGVENSSVTLVDTSFKGTVQELLTEAYPETEFTGRYAFLGKSPDDPRPETKFGYVFHQEADEVWNGLPKSELPEDFSQTFGNKDALGVIEETMHGPLDSPRRITSQGPDQMRQRDVPNPTEGINPRRVAPEYRDARVREAVKVVALDAVTDVARESAQKRDAGLDWKGELLRKQHDFTSEVRSWVEHQQTSDNRLTTVLDSFVRRGDKDQVKGLARELDARDVPPEVRDRAWARFDEKGSVEEKRQFVEQIGKTKTGETSRATRIARDGQQPSGTSRAARLAQTAQPSPGMSRAARIAQRGTLSSGTASPNSGSTPEPGSDSPDGGDIER
ncbi:ABC transporter permease [Nocardiopsis aegyptia]|uniref:Zeta toxin domain-containing protein n=1 Tax=Nocardiopsis aegyptia TaxID=220378 RepID=A0A7Z0EPQ3_9ACTN|nr:ABC transporter permease [Nocardiopsis aegyptia]NYJ35996.1 hypothetical protein [Nocardiopsis aegyptia]